MSNLHSHNDVHVNTQTQPATRQISYVFTEHRGTSAKLLSVRMAAKTIKQRAIHEKKST